jgi:hypothetical protein
MQAHPLGAGEQAMTREVSAQVVIDMPREQAWARLRDISLAHNYVPGIVRTEIVSARTEGVGASRYVWRNARSYLQETVVEWREGEGFLIRLHKGDKPAPPFRSASFRYELADQGSDQTLFTASLQFEMPWGALGNWLEKQMAKPVAATVADVATAMKLYYETGEPTTAAALKAYKAAHR